MWEALPVASRSERHAFRWAHATLWTREYCEGRSDAKSFVISRVGKELIGLTKSNLLIFCLTPYPLINASLNDDSTLAKWFITYCFWGASNAAAWTGEKKRTRRRRWRRQRGGQALGTCFSLSVYRLPHPPHPFRNRICCLLQVAGPSGSPFRGILDIYRTSRLPLRGIVFSFNFRQMLTGFSRLITASWLSAVSLQLPWVRITHRTLAANFKFKIPTEWFSFGYRFSPKCRNPKWSRWKFNQMFKEC